MLARDLGDTIAIDPGNHNRSGLLVVSGWASCKTDFASRGEQFVDGLEGGVSVVAYYVNRAGALNRAVKRNSGRFPADFMFQLTAEEAENLKCQFGISTGWGGRRRSLPYAFTEQGVAMLSSVLHSERAV